MVMQIQVNYILIFNYKTINKLLMFEKVDHSKEEIDS